MPEAKSDTELVRLTQRGGKRAFEELMHRHRGRCLRTAMSVLGDMEDAEDEVQNSWWKVYINLDQFKGESQFTTWLSRIVLNQCLMRLRERRTVRYLYLDAQPEYEKGVARDLRDARPHPESCYETREAEEMVRMEMNCMPKVMRQILILCDVEGLSMQQAAARLAVSVPAAKSRLRRARMELRSRLMKATGPVN
jgi:RNA polymerase sigma-70 factor, ECF subfamily